MGLEMPFGDGLKDAIWRCDRGDGLRDAIWKLLVGGLGLEMPSEGVTESCRGMGLEMPLKNVC